MNLTPGGDREMAEDAREICAVPVGDASRDEDPVTGCESMWSGPALPSQPTSAVGHNKRLFLGVHMPV